MGTTTADVHITLVRLVGTKLWTMEKGRHVMLEIVIDLDNVFVLAVRSYVVYLVLFTHIFNCINLKFKSDLNYIYVH